MENKKLIVEALTPVLEGQMEPEQIESLIEIPSNPEHGDFAFPVFQLAKVFRKAPQMIASELVEKSMIPTLTKWWL